jgi:hypothetical protein
MNFKEYTNQDLQVFINLNEFADTHTIDGRTLTVIVDNDRLMERSQKEYDGAYIGEILYFVNAAEYGVLPETEAIQTFDGQCYYVASAKSEMGMYEIILKGNAI